MEGAVGEPVVGLPSGTVTFLFTDLEVSTRLWEQAAGAHERGVARHNEILREGVVAHGGQIVCSQATADLARDARHRDRVAMAR